MKHIRDTQ